MRDSRFVGFVGLVLVGVLLSAVCGAEGFFDKPVSLIAHRGGAEAWPENTLIAYMSLVEKYPDAIIECDVRMTADGQLVMMHDESVDRTTGGTGKVAEMTWEEIKALDAAYHFSRDGGETFVWRDKNVRVPTFQQALQVVTGTRFMIDIKSECGVDAVPLVLQAIREAGAEERVLLGSFDDEILKAVEEQAPDIPTYYSEGRGVMLVMALRGTEWDAYKPTNEMLSVGEEHIAEFNITPEEIAAIQQKGIRISIWTVDDQEGMEKYLKMGVDGIITDTPEVLAAVLKEADDAEEEQQDTVASAAE